MLGAIATLKVKQEAIAEFETVFAELAAKVREREPDTLYYRLLRSQDGPGDYRVIEVYTSREALKTHMQTDYFTAALPKIGKCLSAPPEMARFDALD